MPAALRYDNLTSEQRRDLEAAYDAERDRRASAYALSRSYYDGDHHKHLKPDNSKTDDNVVVNLVRLVVDKSVATLLGITQADEVETVKFDVVDEDTEKGSTSLLARAARRMFTGQSDEDNPAQQYLDDVMGANHAPLLWAEVATLGALMGHNFVKLLPDGTMTQTGIEVPRIVPINPANASIFWSQDDRHKVLWYRIQYDNIREDIVRNEAMEQGGDGWVILRYMRPTTHGEWKLQSEEQWPYAWSPMVDWPQNPNPGEVYGRSDTHDIIKLNDQYNFTLSNTQRIIKYHAHPKTFGTGFGASDIESTAVGGLWTVRSKDATVTNLEMQSDLASSMAFSETVRRAIFNQARELDPAAVQDSIGQVTNFGLRVLNNDRLTKAGVQRALWSRGLHQIVRAIFDAGGFDMFIPVNIEWPDILSDDPLQQAQALAIDVMHGLSQYSYLGERGYDPELEERRRQTDISEALAQDTTLVQRQATNRLLGGG